MQHPKLYDPEEQPRPVYHPQFEEVVDAWYQMYGINYTFPTRYFMEHWQNFSGSPKRIAAELNDRMDERAK